MADTQGYFGGYNIVFLLLVIIIIFFAAGSKW
jgi:hypothetical protein